MLNNVLLVFPFKLIFFTWLVLGFDPDSEPDLEAKPDLWLFPRKDPDAE